MMNRLKRFQKWRNVLYPTEETKNYLAKMFDIEDSKNVGMSSNLKNPIKQPLSERET